MKRSSGWILSPSFECTMDMNQVMRCMGMKECVTALQNKAENSALDASRRRVREAVTDLRTDGRADGRTDGQTLLQRYEDASKNLSIRYHGAHINAISATESFLTHRESISYYGSLHTNLCKKNVFQFSPSFQMRLCISIRGSVRPSACLTVRSRVCMSVTPSQKRVPGAS